MENLDNPFFGDDVDGYLKWLHTKNLRDFKFVVYRMALARLGLDGGVNTDSGGTCTSQNCFGTTGCHAATTNGSCQCSDPNHCVWVPAV